jgi:hypothetical protein
MKQSLCRQQRRSTARGKWRHESGELQGAAAVFGNRDTRNAANRQADAVHRVNRASPGSSQLRSDLKSNGSALLS